MKEIEFPGGDITICGILNFDHSGSYPISRLQPKEGYEDVAEVLDRALAQTQSGKGKERHATGEPFQEQEIMQGARRCGLGAPVFQIRKKSLEAQRLAYNGDYERAMADILGVIIYAVAEYLRVEEMQGGE